MSPLLRQSHKRNPSGWQRQEEGKQVKLKAVAFTEEAAVGDWWGAATGTSEQMSRASRWATSRGSEGQHCVTTGPLAGPCCLFSSSSSCLKQGSHRAWPWKALPGGSTAVLWHSSWAWAPWSNTHYSRKSTEPQGSMKMPLQVRVQHPGGMISTKS